MTGRGRIIRGLGVGWGWSKGGEMEGRERELLMAYVKRRGLDYESSPFLREYFNGGEDVDEGEDVADSVEELAGRMDELIPEGTRKMNGAYFTPQYIIEAIFRTTRPGSGETVADISCGSGTFLLGAVNYYVREYGMTVRESLRNIYGVDLLAENVRRAKVLIAIRALEGGEVVEESEIRVERGDSLSGSSEGQYDVIVGNPPYVKYQDMEVWQRERLSREYVTTQSGTYNLYYAFFERGYKLLREGGRLGYITPNNYFTTLSGKPLRAFFESRRCLYRVEDFGSAKVFGVQTYTAISYMSKRRNEAIEYSRLVEGETPSEFLERGEYTSNRYDKLKSDKWRLLCGNERMNIERIEGAGVALGSIMDISASIATLKDSVYFVMPEREEEGLIFFRKEGQVWSVEKEVTRRVVKISECRTERELAKNRLRIIYPYEKGHGGVVAMSEEVMRVRYPQCYGYLLSQREVLMCRDKGKREYRPFYAYGRTQGLSKRGVKILTPTFSREPRFMQDSDAEGFYTNGYGLYYKEQGLLGGKNPIGEEGNADVLLKILNSVVMAYYVRKTSVSIEGGYPCYQKNFIERFGVPVLTEGEIVELRGMLGRDVDVWLVGRYGLEESILSESVGVSVEEGGDERCFGQWVYSWL